jgi:hypothetical protein
MKKSTVSIMSALAVILIIHGCIKKVQPEPGTTVKLPDTEANVTTSDTITAKSDITTSTSDTLKLVPITTDVHILDQSYRVPGSGKVRIQIMPYVYLANNYCKQALIQFKSAIATDNTFNLHLVNIRESQGCAVSTSANASVAAYDVFVDNYVGLGTYPLKITVGSVVYTGTITVTATKVTFNWPYTSGVVFTK